MASGKFTKATEDVKRYVGEHEIERTVTQMINMVVTVKPKDPQAYMVRWLLERCDDDQVKNAGVRIYKEVPEVPAGDAADRSREAYDRYKGAVQSNGGE